uniref:CBM20 domain-containing protein n=1 Tax=Chromera velia CCMP2878 TaxID=1169474 RepID=A0A0G4FXR8_9ALVE|eukprot:Cvel_19309.t1-p1 / transcript=Cvel_19309.t1 / gene=Cvel_19309 / organism=Chromera_velia_CCMP2878 / gene_product=Zinc finger protein 283, putative / transcript_product=Zinc finger protein 283, putative / location=Cvel_scaffold1655:6299-8903(-) / protein_length=756 / sequence_SO=supercontig / SO=protein_coding / is_pseudo=false
MVEAETGVVLFACTEVEPREGQTLVVVGCSSEIGGWDVSRSIALHRVKNPAFPGVWMSFPMSHSVCSQVQFWFALVDSQIDGCHGCQTSSAVVSALSAASPTGDRSQDCRGCVWEPLGCGLREVEVVDGGFVLFGGGWGEGGTQVTPLTWADMVHAQQELEQHSLPYVPSELDTEKEQAEEGETKEWGTLEVVFLQKGQSEVRGERRGDEGSDQSFRFAPAAVMNGGGGEGADVFGGQIEKAVSGGMGEGDPVSNPSQRVRESQCVFQETPTEGDGVSAECEGLKHRCFSSLSVSISAPQSDRRVGGQAFVSERVSCVSPFLLSPEQQSPLQKSCLMSQSVPHPVRIHDTHIALHLDRLGGVSGERRLRRGTEYVEDVYSDGSNSVSGCKGPADTDLHSKIPPSLPLSFTLLPLLEHQQGEGHKTHGVALPLKRRRSEAALSEAEADKCDALPGFPVAGEGVVWKGKEGCLMREEKLRRLTVSVSNSARLSSESCVGRGGGEKSARSAEGREFVSTVAFALDARSVEERASVSTAGSRTIAETAEGRAFVGTAPSVTIARSAEGGAFVSMEGGEVSARSAEGRAFVSMEGGEVSARSAEGRASVSTAGGDVSARSAEGRASVGMAEDDVSARIVEGRTFVSTAGNAPGARSAGVEAFVSTAGNAPGVRSAEARASVSTAGNAPGALPRIVEGRTFVSTAGSVIGARSAGVQASVCTVEIATIARTVEVGAAVFSGMTAEAVMSASLSLLCLIDSFA